MHFSRGVSTQATSKPFSREKAPPFLDKRLADGLGHKRGQRAWAQKATQELQRNSQNTVELPWVVEPFVSIPSKPTYCNRFSLAPTDSPTRLTKAPNSEAEASEPPTPRLDSTQRRGARTSATGAAQGPPAPNSPPPGRSAGPAPSASRRGRKPSRTRAMDLLVVAFIWKPIRNIDINTQGTQRHE